jgi:tRNA nucleotidyltransferase (CCA-adding enzyme)
MLRAVRFEQRFKFRIEKRTLELLNEARPLLGQISGDRIRHELDHILDEDQRVGMIERLSELGLLNAIHPALIWDQDSCENLQMLSYLDTKPLIGLKLDLNRGNNLRKLAYILWIIHQPIEKVQAIIRKLRFPATQINVMLAACRLWKDLPWMGNAKLSMIASRLEEIPPLAIYANFLTSRDDHICHNFQAYLDRMNTIAPTITGYDLKDRGLPPGPIYRRILSAIRDGWLDGKIQNASQERAYLEELIRNEPSFNSASE